MLRTHAIAVLLTLLALTPIAFAADEALHVNTAQGTVVKVEKDKLTIKYRLADKTEKNLALKLTCTSHFSTLSTQKRNDKAVMVQKETDAKALVEKQSIAVIHAHQPLFTGNNIRARRVIRQPRDVRHIFRGEASDIGLLGASLGSFTESRDNLVH